MVEAHIIEGEVLCLNLKWVFDSIIVFFLKYVLFKKNIKLMFL